MGIDVNIEVSQPMTVLVEMPSDVRATEVAAAYSRAEEWGWKSSVVVFEEVCQWSALKDGGVRVTFTNDRQAKLRGSGERVEVIEGFIPEAESDSV